MSLKIDQFRESPLFFSLPAPEQQLLEELSRTLRLTYQQLRQLITIARDLQMWDAGSLASWITEIPDIERAAGKQRSARVCSFLTARWEEERRRGPDYSSQPPAYHGHPQHIAEREAPETILGACPVASEKTRCCNLLTLDAAVNCGFACAYCTIQSFYADGHIFMHRDLDKALEKIEIDPELTYHIGTGQSSDSLMWGDHEGLLEKLFRFATAHPNIILELKTKSANIAYLLENPPPRNVLTTWTLNSDEMIRYEEHGTASLEERMEAARRVADAGSLVGFHFHPLVPHRGWREAYSRVFTALTTRFDPESVALVSFGTLTFIKPVIRAIRERGEATQVLRMPLTDTAGKFSYPEEIKRELFRFAYEALASWHGKVFFYLCMEPPELWEPVFGFSYPDNESFEEGMKSAYLEKIRS
jgi:DNA repair photolyase